MPPLLESAIRFRKHQKGFPRKCVAKFFYDRIELSDKNGMPLETYPLQRITRVAYGNNVIVLLVDNREIISLYFESLARRIFFRAGFGLMGKMYVLNFGHSKSMLDAWLNELQSRGIETRKAR